MKSLIYLVLIGVVAYGLYQYGDTEQFQSLKKAFQVMQPSSSVSVESDALEQLIRDHAHAWENYDEGLFLSTIADDVVFAYSERRLSYDELVKDYRAYHDAFTDTKIYINHIVVDGDTVAIEWQFASTNKDTGARTAVSNAIVVEVQNGKIHSWKEYVDGRVRTLQAVGELPLEEGQEPFPWPSEIQE